MIEFYAQMGYDSNNGRKDFGKSHIWGKIQKL